METTSMIVLEHRVENVNRRLAGTGRAVVVEGRNGQIGLDEYLVEGTSYGACVRTITVGTKREVADFLHAMMVGIDLSRVEPDTRPPFGSDPSGFTRV